MMNSYSVCCLASVTACDVAFVFVPSPYLQPFHVTQTPKLLFSLLTAAVHK